MTFKEKVVDYIKSQDQAVSKDEIASHFKLSGRDKHLLGGVLRDLISDGLIKKDSNRKYTIESTDNICQGVLDMAEGGFGFVVVEGRDDDIFVSKDHINTAMDSDTVLVEILEEAKGTKKAQGRIKKVVKRNLHRLVGRIEISKGFAFVVADKRSIKDDIFISKDNILSAKDGQKVLVEITKYPRPGKSPEGRVIEVLGYPGDEGIDVLSIALDRGFSLDFPHKVVEEALYMPKSVSQKDMEGRLDLRDEMIFTIDGKDAKDLDDAVSIEKLDGGSYRLGVHIADVAHYVREKSPLDKEARERGNSVYLIDRVIPMLPTQLSNGICSLNPGEDRLCLSVIMDIDRNGRVTRSDIKESVINSKYRLNYSDVSDYLEDGSASAKEILGETVDYLHEMRTLRDILYEKRRSRGAIDFEFDESKIIIDDKGRVLDIQIEDVRIANRIIEEFMLVTNETVSETYYWLETPFLYRIHEYPDEDKIGVFLSFVRGFGYSVRGSQGDIHPREFQDIVDKIKGTEEEMVISRMMLRSLKKAKYSSENDIHFGLSSRYYSHFTAPIRRYPDLQIHRIIKEHLSGGLSSSRYEHYDKILPQVADHSSQTEREAEDAERDVEKIKKAEYMHQFIGQTFSGIISGITSFGIFVELDNTVEGLIHYSTIDDYLIYDPDLMQAVSESTGRIYKLGQRVDIIVAFVDKTVGIIDFAFYDEDKEAK